MVAVGELGTGNERSVAPLSFSAFFRCVLAIAVVTPVFYHTLPFLHCSLA
jgi:hypothetical protein